VWEQTILGTRKEEYRESGAQFAGRGELKIRVVQAKSKDSEEVGTIESRKKLEQTETGLCRIKGVIAKRLCLAVYGPGARGEPLPAPHGPDRSDTACSQQL
jgi:hypothetical protein